MRTAVIIFAGFVLWAACVGAAKVFAASSPTSMMTATAVFVILWLLASAANLWIGVTKAGYSFGEELPIFLLIFLLPAVVAAFVKWKFL
jgi:hypothetical protein